MADREGDIVMSSWTAVVTCLALVLYAALAVAVARARAKYNIPAPATTGHPFFERILRVQANTSEQMLLFLPSLWLFSFYVSAGWASVLGIIWIAARIAYAVGYARDPERRLGSFAVGLGATIALFLGSIAHLFRAGAG
jgi:uncharacterized membrane protein YecN with MAPEG domain